MKNNVDIASRYCLVGKIWENMVVYVAIRRDDTRGMRCFLSKKKTNIKIFTMAKFTMLFLSPVHGSTVYGFQVLCSF